MAEQPTNRPPKLYDFQVPATYDADGNPIQVLEQDFDSAVLGGKAYIQKGQKIPVIDPDGRAGTINSDELHEALKLGYKYQPAALQLSDAEKEYYGSGSQQLLSGLEGLARGATLGGSDLILSSVLGNKEEMQKRKEINSELALGTEITGAVAPSLLSGGTGLAGTAARLTPAYRATQAGEAVNASLRAAMGVSENLAAKSLAGKVISTVVPRAAGSAVEGAIYGAGNFISEASLGDTEATAENLLATMGTGALFAGGIGAGIGGLEAAGPVLKKYLDKGVEAGRSAGKKALAAAFGVTEKNIDDYLAMKASGQSLDEASQEIFNKVFTGIEDEVFKLDAAVEKGKDKLAIAKSDFDDWVELKMADHKELIGKKKEELALLKEEAKRIAEDRIEELKNVTAVGTRDKISEALSELDRKVSAGSSKAYEILKADPNKTFELKPFYNAVDDVAANIPAKTSLEGQEAIKKLNATKQRIFDAYGDGPVPLDDVKDILRGLDADSKYNHNALESDKIANSAIKKSRRFLDTQLKDISPEYAKQMKQVAADTELLNRLRPWGEEGKAFSKLHNIASPKAREIELPFLKELEKRTGIQFTDEIDKFVNAKDILGSPKARKNIYKGSKEAKAAKEMEAFISQMTDPKEMMKFRQTLAQSAEAKAVQEAGAGLEFAKAEREKLSKFKAGSLEGQIKSAARGKIESARQLEGLTLPDGTPVLEALEKYRTAAAFEGGFTRGSKNVNTYAILLGALTGGIDGAAFGALVGSGVDKYGPAIARSLLDGAAFIKGLETNNSAISNAVKSAIKVFSVVKDKGIDAAKTISTIDYIKKNKLDSDRSERGGSKSRKEKYKKRLEEMARLKASPSIMIDNMASNSSELSKWAPKTSEALQRNAIRALDFLYDKAPKDPAPSSTINPVFRRWEPSDRDLAKFERYFSAVDNPMTVVKDLKTNSVTPEQVEAIRVVYPSLYSQIQSEVISQLTEIKHDLPYQKKLQLSTLFGISVDETTKPGFVSFLQQQTLSARLGVDASQGGAPKGTPKLTNSGGRFKIGSGEQAPSDKIMEGIS